MSNPSSRPEANGFLDAALEYAARGWLVLPLKPGSKAPITRHGFKDASKSKRTIRRWWRKHPDANVGVRTGRESGLVILDVDRHGDADGEASLAELAREHADVPATLEVRTPNGGRHLYFAHPGGEVRSRTGLRPGVDLKGEGGYVVAPPSMLEGCGEPYAAQNGSALAPTPEWLLEEASRQPSPASSPTTPAPSQRRSRSSHPPSTGTGPSTCCSRPSNARARPSSPRRSSAGWSWRDRRPPRQSPAHHRQRGAVVHPDGNDVPGPRPRRLEDRQPAEHGHLRGLGQQRRVQR